MRFLVLLILALPIAAQVTPKEQVCNSTGALCAPVTANGVTVQGAGTAGAAAGGVVTVQGSASGTAIPVSGTVTITPSGTQAVSNAGTFAVQNTAATPAGSAIIGKVGIDQTTPGTTNLVALAANQSVNTAQINAHTALEGGANGSQAVGGTVATNVAITANPINLGAQAVSSENSAVTTARQVQLVADLVGKLITLPYANPENFVNGTTSAITDTTSTSVIASAGGSLRNYITSCIVTNSSSTVGTFVKILDGSTIIWEGYATTSGGWTTSFPVPLRGTAATAINAQAVTTGANFIVSCAGYKGI